MNDFDVSQSLHIPQVQRSNFVKLDDNLLQFKFSNSRFNYFLNPKSLTDEQLMNMKEDLNTVQLKFNKAQNVKRLKWQMFRYERDFCRKVIMMTVNGHMIEKLNKINSLLLRQ